MLKLLSLIILFRTEETRSCSGTKQTGSLFASRVMTRRLGMKIAIQLISFDRVETVVLLQGGKCCVVTSMREGRGESLPQKPTKTGAPSNVHFREIKKGQVWLCADGSIVND